MNGNRTEERGHNFQASKLLLERDFHKGFRV